MSLEEGLALEGEELEVSEDLGDELSPIESEARAKGWSPEGIEGKRNLTAEEFLDRQPLYDKMHKTDRAMKRLEEQNKAITAHLEMIRRTTLEGKVDALKSKKREALEERDHDEVMRIDEEIIKASQDKDVPVSTAPVTNDAFDQWLGENQWYDNNDEMRKYADKYGAGVLATNPNMDLKDVYQEVADEVKHRFADSFVTNRKQTSPVEGSRPRSRAKVAKHTVKDLDSDAKMIHDNLVRSGVMSTEEYIADLEKTGYFN